MNINSTSSNKVVVNCKNYYGYDKGFTTSYDGSVVVTTYDSSGEKSSLVMEEEDFASDRGYSKLDSAADLVCEHLGLSGSDVEWSVLDLLAPGVEIEFLLGSGGTLVSNKLSYLEDNLEVESFEGEDE